jgi:hypothetical protein
VLAGISEVSVKNSVHAGSVIVRYSVSGGRTLVRVMKSSEIVVRVIAGCVEIKMVVTAGCRLVTNKISVEAGKNEVWIWTVVSVPVSVTYSVFVAVDGASCVVTVRKKLEISVCVKVEAGSREVSTRVLMIIVVSRGSVEVKVISTRLVWVEAASAVVCISVVKNVVVSWGRTEVSVMKKVFVSVDAGTKLVM